MSILMTGNTIHTSAFVKRLFGFTLVCLILFCTESCIDNEALRGRLTLNLTDAPADASTISEVNIAIRGVEVLRKGSETWQVIKSFEEPKTLNILDFTNGKTYNLTEQYLTPGEYDGLRLELNLANVDNGLTVFPQSNLIFTNGTQEVLFVSSGNTSYVESRSGFKIETNQTTFLTLDFDVRKSLVIENGDYALDPTMRVVETGNCGTIDGQFRDFGDYPKSIVLAYTPGTYTSAEATNIFANAISSTKVNANVSGRFTLAFLEQGNYELIFVALNNDGSVKSILGKLNNVPVTAEETISVCTQLDAPQVQGNCVQLQLP